LIPAVRRLIADVGIMLTTAVCIVAARVLF